MKRFMKQLLVLFFIISTCTFAKEIKVGLILAMGGLGDKSFNDSAYRGLKKAEKDFDIEVKYVEPSSWSEDSIFITEFAENDYDLIIATSYTAQDAMTQLAGEFPDTKFAIVDTTIEGVPNTASLVFSEEEGSFLVGALAAMMSENNSVGFIGAVDIPLINNFRRGYEQGAKYINPEISTTTIYIGGNAPFNDPVKGKEATYSLANQGVDVVYHASGNTGVGMMEAVKDLGIYAIGVDSDQDYMVEGQVITSMLKNVDNAVYALIKDTVEGNFEGKAYKFGLAEDGVGTTDFKYTREVIGEKKIQRLEEIKKDIIDGKIVIK